MRLKVYPKSPAPRHIEQIVAVLKSGGVAVLPTDSVYSFAAAANNVNAMQKLAALKGIPLEKAKFSFVFSSLGMIGDFTKPLNRNVYAMMNRLLPGPFTFILNASGQVGKLIPNKKTIGVRIPNNPIPCQVIEALGSPIVTTSVYDDDTILEYTTDPDIIAERLERSVDLVVDGGFGHNEPSTILDCTGEEILMIRKGLGIVQEVA